MPELLYLTNFPEVNIVERTQLDAAVAAAAVSATIENLQNFLVDDYVVMGRVTSEQAEKLQLTAASGQAIGFAACKFPHNKGEEVVKLRGDQIRVYRASNSDGDQPADSAFQVIATVTINVKRSYTEYNDPDGGAGFWYKIIYHNSTNGNETDITESPAVRGGNFGHYATVEQVRATAGFGDNSDVIDEKIAEARDEAEGTVKGYLMSARYILPIEAPYPASVVRLVRQLAAAYLLQDEYGAAAQGSTRDGYEQEKSVMAKLEAIQKGKQTLVDVNQETITPKEDDVAGWPDDSTETTSSYEHGGPPRFTMSKRW